MTNLLCSLFGHRAKAFDWDFRCVRCWERPYEAKPAEPQPGPEMVNDVPVKMESGVWVSNFCGCGCLRPVSSGRRFISGHNLKARRVKA